MRLTDWHADSTLSCFALKLCPHFLFFSHGSDDDYVIVREIYENDNAAEYFENELEKALEDKVPVIIIEPYNLGEETARWVTVGNCLHKTAVLAGLGCLCTGYSWPDQGFYYLPLGFVSVVCAGVYTISWQFDPCCKYQLEYDPKKLQKVPLHHLTSGSPVILVRKDDFRRKVLHTTISVLATAFCTWKVYEWYFKP